MRLFDPRRDRRIGPGAVGQGYFFVLEALPFFPFRTFRDRALTALRAFLKVFLALFRALMSFLFAIGLLLSRWFGSLTHRRVTSQPVSFSA